MPERGLRRALTPGALSLLASLAGCGDDEAARGIDPNEYAEGRAPVPGCESHDYGRCDVRDLSCQRELYAIAACLREGTMPADGSPPVEFWSEAEAESDWLSTFRASPRPDPDHFEIALTHLGLTRPSALQPEQVAQRLAQNVGAFYHNDRKNVVVIDHSQRQLSDATAPDGPWDNALVLHEMIHALQDRDHDLRAFAERYRVGFEANLRGESVVEGEATLHARRYLAARAGLDLRELDLERTFDNLVLSYERQLMSAPDLYSATDDLIPYSHGGAFVLGTFLDGGQPAVRALFDAPPRSTRDVLAAAWNGEVGGDVLDLGTPVDPGVAGARLEAWTPMGAWGVYLLEFSVGSATDLARKSALSWRGDQLRVFGLAAGGTAAIWEIELFDEAAAAELHGHLSGRSPATVTRSASRVTLRFATAETPPGLFPP